VGTIETNGQWMVLWNVEQVPRYRQLLDSILDEVPPRSNTFVMAPGDGVYMYPWVPHWVENGPAAAISLSITFRTRRSERHERVQLLTRRLRRLGLSPTPPGDSALLDHAKASAASAPSGGRAS
jgi:hypothetical protein